MIKNISSIALRQDEMIVCLVKYNCGKQRSTVSQPQAYHSPLNSMCVCVCKGHGRGMLD